MELDDLVRIMVSGVFWTYCIINRFLLSPTLSQRLPSYDRITLQLEHYLNGMALSLTVSVGYKYGGAPPEIAPVAVLLVDYVWDGISPKILEGKPQYDQLLSDTLGAGTAYFFI